ncbi:uncharacterized protein LDX57_012138 [Aspergillus melleus]|uniref:uncharacterized protein n=1 Tax=Aspergillus melleus TaxID=138277 RepID=UPI001E8CA001|nr:uncharacterized protein LDX57_012138 [Aspergillus melleus]KAH8434493.1 hypothetical protein LDX57_012138 [Aspergillus melleus]
MARISAYVDRVFRRSKKSKGTANERSTGVDQPGITTTSPGDAPLPAMTVFPGPENNTRTQLPAESVTTPNSPTTSITLEQTTTKPPMVEENADREVQVDPWTRAFELFQERTDDQELVSAYTDHLGFVQGDGSAGPDLSRKSSVETVVEKLLEDRDQKQWKITIMDRDIKIRSQLEKLAKFLSWSDPVVKSAVSTQPYAALAWSGVSLILPWRHTKRRYAGGVQQHWGPPDVLASLRAGIS